MPTRAARHEDVPQPQEGPAETPAGAVGARPHGSGGPPTAAGGSSASAWIRSIRPLGAGMVVPPALLGVAWSVAEGARPGAPAVAAALAVALAAQVLAVWCNDLGDVETDRDNATFNAFSGGSRVLVDGRIRPRTLRQAATALAAALLGGCAGLGWAFGAPALPALGLACVAIAWGYSLPPLRASYRGLGALLQGLGTGVLLPCIGYQLGTGGAWPADPTPVAAAALAGVSANVATALADTPSDARHARRTVPVLLGEPGARAAAWLLAAVAVTVLGRSAADAGVGAAGVGLVVGPAGALLLLAAALGRRAGSTDRVACARFVLLVVASAGVAMLAAAAVLALGADPGAGRVG